jgi:hypothetical protein
LALKNSKDLQFFLDIKNYMYFSLDKKQNDLQSMAEKKYNKIQMKSLFNNKFFFDTENYKKTTQYFNNVFLNYKHGIFYPDKNKIKKINNKENEEELKNKEKEIIKKLYVEKNLNSFFSVLKEGKHLKENKNYEIFKSKYICHSNKQKNIYKNKKTENKINIKTMTNFNSNKNLKSNSVKKNHYIRKIEDFDFELIKKSQDKLYKTSSNLNNFYSPKNKIFNAIDTYFNANKNKNNINDDLMPLLRTESNFNYTDYRRLYKISINNMAKNNNDKDEYKYLQLNSMNEVLNSKDISDNQFLKKLKNIFIQKNIFVGNKPKSIKIKNLKLDNKRKFEKENLHKIKQSFYYNKSLGCRINFKKIILGNNINNYSGERTPKHFSSFPFTLNEISSVKRTKEEKKYVNHNIDNKTNIISYSDLGFKIRLNK